MPGKILSFHGLPLLTFKTDRLDLRGLEYERIAFLNDRVFDVIFSSIQLSQDFKVSNGGPLNKKTWVT